MVLALIDTGADECALPAGLAPRLGHTLELGTAKTVSTAGGQFTAFRHTSEIAVEGLLSREAIIDFIPGLGMPLLGVRSFLSGLVLTVDYPRETFTLTIG